MPLNADQLLEKLRGKSLRTMRHLCFEASRELKPDDALKLAKSLLAKGDLRGLLAATLIAGHVSYLLPEALAFLKDRCASSPEKAAQDCLARAFDHYCLNRGYERAMPAMKAWAKDQNPNLRRAVLEAPRPWSRKDAFARHPELAIKFISGLRADEEASVRVSAGNALAEVSVDFPELVVKELKGWNLKQAWVRHTYSFAAKHVHAKVGTLFTK
jgi:3-methyladenine DNA glycosylase AlkC